jgi:anti-sigma regulatory factor (Ser/Thr protein kinase)
MSDRITLTIPRERPFHSVAHLVLGGLAVRHNLTLENLEDMQVALDELLEHDEELSDVTVELRVHDSRIEAEIGPFREETLRAATEPTDGVLGLSRVLAAVVDGVEQTERNGGSWLKLVKTVEAPA